MGLKAITASYQEYEDECKRISTLTDLSPMEREQLKQLKVSGGASAPPPTP